MTTPLPRLLLAAPASGAGKTTAALALLGALARRGVRPAAFKCGPDYIDPMFHREILGLPGCNLDLFFAGPEIVRGLLAREGAGSDVAVIESAMGYYDGVGASDRASGWRVAAETETPVVLVLNPRGAFLSLAALVKGFVGFRTDSRLRGFILNPCGERLHSRLSAMLEKETGLAALGYLPNLPEAVFESRRLGLTPPGEMPAIREKAAALAEQAERTLNLEGLLDIAASAPPIADAPPTVRKAADVSVRIAVARDAAFCFNYHENLDLLRAFGADVVEFSPLDDREPPEGTCGLFIGGGYPELHAERLSANAPMLEFVRTAVADGMPVVAECGGFLYLHAFLEDPRGVVHPMAGVIDGTARNQGRAMRFGYAELTAERDTLLLPKGSRIPFHEFHYWDSDNPGDACSARKPGGDGAWRCVHAEGNLFAGFPHLYFWSAPAMAERFVRATAHWRNA